MTLVKIFFFVCLTIALWQLCLAHNQPTYTIIVPSRIRSNCAYHVSVQLVNATKPVNVEAAILGPSTYATSQSLSVDPFETKIANLSIGEWPSGQYKLRVEGHSEELEIVHETLLTFEPKGYSIFVQTDKPIYKPAQVVKFRTIIVNRELIPTLNRSVDVFIKDPQDNLIKQWKGASPYLGVVSGELQLSEQPPLGKWSIRVDIQSQQYTKVFTVDEYILPTFSVDIHLSPHATYGRSDVIVTVRATYTFGQPVMGECTLLVTNPSRIELSTSHKTKLNSDGSVDFALDYFRDLTFPENELKENVQFVATVEESLTGKTYNKTVLLTVHKHEFNIEAIETSNVFKPGMRYTAFFKVAYRDGSPVEDNGPPVSVQYRYSSIEWSNSINCTTVIPVRGLIRFDVNLPKDNILFIEFKVRYRKNDFHFKTEECAVSPSNSFIHISMNDQTGFDELFQVKSVNVGQNVTFQVNATEPLTSGLVYEVMANDDIVHSGQVSATTAATATLAIAIPITHRMVPKANLLVYYVREQNQEIVADTMSFNVEGILRTPVRLTSNVNQTKPGDRVDLSVHTKPLAYVALLGVDQSVSLLKSENDITQNDILQELKTFEHEKKSIATLSRSKRYTIPDTDPRPIYPFNHDLYEAGYSTRVERMSNIRRRSPNRYVESRTSTIGNLFANLGVIIFTNALIYEKVKYAEYHQNRQESGPWWIDQYRDFDFESGFFNNAYVSHAISYMEIIQKAQPQSYEPPSQQPKQKLRQHFPETWIWSNITAASDGIAKLSSTIPDTITSWHISAFAVHPTTGLGVSRDTLNIKVFRPFFLKLSLPYSILRGESVRLQVLVYNYQAKAVSAEVIMENVKNQFDFTSSENDIDNGQAQGKKEQRKTITIAPFDGASVYFVITPNKVGYIDLKVRAVSANAGDAILRKLLVKPEGQTQYLNTATFFKLEPQYRSTGVIKKNMSIEIPQNAVPGSVKVMVSGIADILGPTVNNMDDLLRMPYGCGEQNMINLVPNILVLNYLCHTKRLTNSVKTKALNHILCGYQRELTYRRSDGSFSVFGSRDKLGSTWLTAYVVKTFIQARSHIDVDPSVISKSIGWLFRRQKKDGSFVENGWNLDRSMQGGVASNKASNESNSAVLTAYVLIAILHEDNFHPSRNEEKILKAEDYIYRRLLETDNTYEIAIISYALHLAYSKHRDFAYSKLMLRARRNANGTIHWSDQLNANCQNKIHLCVSDSLPVETTAYALLTLMARMDMPPDGLSALKWLISKQNSNGGFASTQDTVIGLEALCTIAEKMFSAKQKMSIAISFGSSQNGEYRTESQSMQLNADNLLVLQQIQLNPNAEWVALEATGFGSAIVQLSYQYNIALSSDNSAFALSAQIGSTSNEEHLMMDICAHRHIKEANSSNMALMQVELPSGYCANLELLPSPDRLSDQAKQVKRVDTANNGVTVYIYFDRITQNKVCITISADNKHKVANSLPVPVTLYDYYDRSKMARIFYQPKRISVENISHDVINTSSKAVSFLQMISNLFGSIHFH